MPRNVSFQIYVYATLKDQDPNSGITKGAMEVMNSLVNVLAVKLSTKSVKLAQLTDRKTVQSVDVKAADQRIFPAELSKHAYSEVEKAIRKYQQSKA